MAPENTASDLSSFLEVTFPVTVPPGTGATLRVRGYLNGKCKAAQQLTL